MTTLLMSELTPYDLVLNKRLNKSLRDIAKRRLYGEYAKMTYLSLKKIQLHFEKAVTLINDEETIDQDFEIINEIMVANCNKILLKYKMKKTVDWILLKYHLCLLTKASHRVRSTLVSNVLINLKIILCLLIMLVLPFL